VLFLVLDILTYGWFSQTKFRQAMSCLLNRGRIASQVYRGLAVPALYFFAKANPFVESVHPTTPSYQPPVWYAEDGAMFVSVDRPTAKECPG